MNLKKNSKWHDDSIKMFQFNIEVNNGKENCKVDYALVNDDGVLLCYGFDLPDDSLNEENIFDFLMKERDINEDLSLMTKIFNFYDYSVEYNGKRLSNPMVFLATLYKIYYMPNGIRQMNPFYWESVEYPKLLKEKLGT